MIYLLIFEALVIANNSHLYTLEEFQQDWVIPGFMKNLLQLETKNE